MVPPFLILLLSVMAPSVQGASALAVGLSDTRVAGAIDEVGGALPEAASPQIDGPPCCTERQKPEKQKVEPPRRKFNHASAEVAVTQKITDPANEKATAIELPDMNYETPPCCTKQREPEKQTVGLKRSKTNSEGSEVAVPRTIVTPKDEIVITAYADRDTPDYANSPCCTDERQLKKQKVESPKLRIDHAAAEVAISITVVLMSAIGFWLRVRRRSRLGVIRPLIRQPVVMVTHPPIKLPSPEIAKMLRVDELV